MRREIAAAVGAVVLLTLAGWWIGSTHDHLWPAPTSAAAEPARPASPLLAAVSGCDLESVRRCVARGDTPNVRDDAGRTPLHVAAAMVASAAVDPPTVQTSLAIVQLLLEHGADPNAQTPEGATPLLGDCCCPDVTAMRLLVEHGADVNLADAQGVTPLIKACETGDNLPTVRYLVEQGAQVKHADKQGRTALHEAARWDEEEVVAYLLEQGAEVNARDGLGRTPIFYGVEDPDNFPTQSPPLLLEAGADVTVIDNWGLSLVEHTLWNADRPKLARDFLRRGAPYSIHAACGLNDVAKVQQLLDRGVSPSLVHTWGNRSPLHWTARFRSTQAAELLVERGAKLDPRDEKGWTPLHVACARWTRVPLYATGVAKALIEAGADANARTNKGETPLDVCAHTADSTGELVDLLRQHGAQE